MKINRTCYKQVLIRTIGSITGTTDLLGGSVIPD